jgi:hypothetical protein
MKVRLLISRAGKDFSQSAGDVVEIEQAEALRMIDAGQCVKIGEPERATSKKKTEKRKKAK